MIFTRRFSRMYSLYRDKEREAEMWLDIAEGLEETVADLQKEAKSDKALIESLNRYIEGLEGKAKMQAETIQELRERLASNGLPWGAGRQGKNKGGAAR